MSDYPEDREQKETEGEFVAESGQHNSSLPADYPADESTAVEQGSAENVEGVEEEGLSPTESVDDSSFSLEQDNLNDVAIISEEERVQSLQAGEHEREDAIAEFLKLRGGMVPVSDEDSSASDGGELTPEQLALPWFVVHVYSGFELRAKLNLEERIRSSNLYSKFGQIIVPEEKVVELVRGEKKTSSRKFYPGYILVQCELTDETWHLVKDTPKVTGFVGDSRNPVPLSKGEVDALVQQMEGGTQRSRPSAQFEQGDSIKVIDGPFVDFNGTVEEVKPDKGKLKVLISIFGRNTPVELDFVQVEKV